MDYRTVFCGQVVQRDVGVSSEVVEVSDDPKPDRAWWEVDSCNCFGDEELEKNDNKNCG